MGKASWGRKKRLVVDIGSSAIRLCELAQTKSGYQLVKYYQKEYSSDPAQDEDTRKQQRAAALNELLKEAKVRAKSAIFGVPGQSVFTRTRSLPPVPEFKVPQIVRYEIQQQIPFSLDQIAMDYQLLGRSEAGGYEVMMAAIKTDVVDKHIETLQSAKKTVDMVDVSPVAAYNWLKHSGEMQSQGECVALIDLGASTTDIIIEKDNLFRFTRPLNMAGNDITQAISQNFGMSFDEAERLKRERGFAPTGDPQQDGKGGEVIGGVLQRMVTEIMRSFAYFRSMPGGSPVTRVVLCGGGACLRNIVPYLQRQLQIDVRIAQPLTGLAVSPEAQQVSEHPEQACIALGLALRCNETVPVEINLIPPRMLEAQRRKVQVAYWAAIFALLLVTLLSTIPQRAKANEWNLKRIEDLKRGIRLYDPGISLGMATERAPVSQYKGELMQAKKEIDDVKKKLEVLDEARKGRNFWLDEMLLLNGVRPVSGNLWFTSIETTTISKATTGGRGAHRSLGARGARGGGAAGGGGGRGGSRYDDDDEDSGRGAAATSDDDDDDDPRSRRGGLFGGLGTAGPAGAGASTPSGPPSDEEMDSTGFPMHTPNIPMPIITGKPSAASGITGNAAMSSGIGLRGGGDDDDDDRGGSGGRRGGRSGRSGLSLGGSAGRGGADIDPQEAELAFNTQNGFFVKGYARDRLEIKQFIEDLKVAEGILPNKQFLWVERVYFTEGSVRELDYNILYDTNQDNWEGIGTAFNPNNRIYSFIVQLIFKRSDTPKSQEAETPTTDEVNGAQ